MDNAIQIPSISSPQGGGAVKGIDEKFTVNAVNGTASLSIPLATASGRGLAPGLSIDYDSGNGNGIFGLGWSLSLSSISRKTGRRIPEYDDEADEFLLSGAEDLVPKFLSDGRGGFLQEADGRYRVDEERQGEALVRRYVPRTEGGFARIERHLLPDGTLRWKVVDRANVTTLFGWSPASRLASPDGKRIFKWLPEFTYDSLGNCLAYFYEQAGAGDVDPARLSDANRIRDGRIDFSGIYLTEVCWTNVRPWFPGSERPAKEAYRFRLEFRYERRPDAFSDGRAGFGIRTTRLCTQVLKIHRFEQLPGGEAVVSSLDPEYRKGEAFTLLESVRTTGWTRHADGTYSRKSLPATHFSYQEHRWDTALHSLDLEVGNGFYFTDLDGEGIPGLLLEQEGTWYYRRNLGGGRFGKPVSVKSRPSFTGASLYLADLEGDGCKQLVNLSFAPQGFFEKKDDGSWESMQPFRTLPRAELDAPGTRMIDLDGDGRADILVSEDHVYTWYASEGRQGFSTGGSVPKAFDENVGPNVSFVDARQSVFLADMTGDGLVDIVRVRNGEVCYWPNLGYGRFGAKVTLDGSPVFAAPDRFDPSRIRFTDLDGSGPSDIVYLGNGKVECWLNRSGNSLSGSPVVIDGIPELSRAATVDFIDLFGQGVPCLVLSSPTARPGVRGLKYIDLRAGMKPWLMDGYATGSGQRTSFGYTSSVQFYLEDLLAGTPWPERLAMPVHCLTSVETVDLVSGHRYAAHYTYHNGHYDHAEKEFRGFGLVVQTDTEDFEHWKGESTNLLSADLHQEPVITRLWTRTGSVTESIEIENADAMDAAEWREAHRAARGSAARQTVSDASGRLYSETAGEVLVRRLQPRGQNRHAVFLPLPSRSMTWQYENGDLSDPQVSQTVPVRFDDLGNLLESASIAYPRKKRDETLPQDVVRMQEETHITYQVSHFTEDIDTADVHCLRVPYRSESYVLEHVPCRGDVYSRADFADWERYAELAGKSWTRFYSDDLRTPAPDGKIAFPVVNYENFILAYPDGLPEELFGDRVGEGRLRAAHYVRLDGEDGWWVPSGRALLLEDGETVADARNRFYLATVYETLLGARTKVFFSDPDCLLLAAVEDPFGNVSRVREFDYRSLSPVLVEDINGNLSATVTDELGMVMASAVMGKGSEADSLAGFDDRTSAADEPLVKAFFEATAYPELEALAKQLLRSATSRYVYRLDRFEQEGKPLCSALISREQHAAVQPDSDVQISFTYTSGLGQVILSKVQAEVPGDDRAVRWLGNGRTVLNNKGNAVMQYEPYFSDTPAFEDAKEMVEQGVTPLLHYDPLGRLVRTDFPDGTFTKVAFTQWGSAAYDPVDTVKESAWYAERMAPGAGKWDRSAAEKSAALAENPTRTYVDSLGRAVYAVAPDGVHSTTWFDKFGRTEKVVDARENVVARYRYDLLGNPVVQAGMDKGTRWVFPDATGTTAVSWDERGHTVEQFCDIAGRPVYTVVRGGDGARPLDHIVSRIVYGEDLLPEEGRESLQQKNFLGRALRTYDTAGLARTEAVDFAGRVLSASWRLAADYKGTVDWREDRLEAGLEAETFRTRTAYDALGRVVSSVWPDGSEVKVSFGRGLMPTRQTLRQPGENEAREYIKSLTYNEKRQRSRIVYGNGVSSAYTYDPRTFQLVRLLTTRKNGDVLQDLNYTYDAAAHVTHLADDAVPVSFGGNSRITGDADYTYDANFRLIEATGRENNAALSAPHPGNDRAYRSTFAKGDPVGLRTYTERYRYDAVGNILQIKHLSAGNNWTRDYGYAATDNRLLETTVGDAVTRYTYHDRHGFLTSMEHLSRMEWNFRDELSLTVRQAGSDETVERTYYQYDASGRRVRKLTVSGPQDSPVVKDERIYLGGIEIYRRHSGVYKGLERITQHLGDDGGRDYVLIETRNGVDDGTARRLARYQFGNLVGSCSLELDEDAEVIGYEEYHPYGSTAYHAMNRAVRAAEKRYRFTGMERDEETGLQYHTARYYIPWLGRWSSPDPIGIRGGINLYAYCSDSPIARSDPAGTEDEESALSGAMEDVDLFTHYLHSVAFGPGYWLALHYGKDVVDKVEDFADEHFSEKGQNRVKGFVQTVSGISEIVTGIGVTTESGGIGAGVGVAIYLRGIDDAGSGIFNLLYGTSNPTYVARGVAEVVSESGGNDKTSQDAAVLTDTLLNTAMMFSPGVKMKPTPRVNGRVLKPTKAQVASEILPSEIAEQQKANARRLSAAWEERNRVFYDTEKMIAERHFSPEQAEAARREALQIFMAKTQEINDIHAQNRNLEMILNADPNYVQANMKFINQNVRLFNASVNVAYKGYAVQYFKPAAAVLKETPVKKAVDMAGDAASCVSQLSSLPKASTSEERNYTPAQNSNYTPYYGYSACY